MGCKLSEPFHHAQDFLRFPHVPTVNRNKYLFLGVLCQFKGETNPTWEYPGTSRRWKRKMKGRTHILASWGALTSQLRADTKYLFCFPQ